MKTLLILGLSLLPFQSQAFWSKKDFLAFWAKAEFKEADKNGYVSSDQPMQKYRIIEHSTYKVILQSYDPEARIIGQEAADLFASMESSLYAYTNSQTGSPLAPNAEYFLKFAPDFSRMCVRENTNVVFGGGSIAKYPARCYRLREDVQQPNE